MSFVIYPPINPVAFVYGSMSIRWYGVILSFAIFVGIVCAYFISKNKYDRNFAELLLDSVFPVVLFSIIGARFFYVVGDLDFYIRHPAEIFLINHGGLSIYGAIFFGVISLSLFFKLKKVNALEYFDIYALAMPLCQAIGRWGNYFNQEAFGRPCKTFIKLYVDKLYRPFEYMQYSFFHPTFLYECVLNLILFIILLFIFLKAKNYKTGLIFSLYLIFYSLIRLFVESYRIDSIMNVSGMPVASVISLITLIFGVLIFFYIKKHPA